MTSKQMLRAMRKWGISVVATGNCWTAFGFIEFGISFGRVKGEYSGHFHPGATPEIAVEDYCNARDLKWDV
jgi:hypothetical protein